MPLPDCPRGMRRSLYQVRPVGVVHSSFKTEQEVTDSTVDENKGEIEMFAEYEGGLTDLEGFSHVVVLYWFDKNDTPSKRSILQTRLQRFAKKPLAGVFASRAPVRPNLIALSVCRILSVQGNTVRVQSIDAFDGTPILDLKPHIPMIDSPSNVKLPDWWKPGGLGGDLAERVMSFDSNGDGKVTKDEMPERMKERLLPRADANGDGALDKQEAKQFAGQMGQGRSGPASPGGDFVDRVMGLDKNGDGKVTKDEMPERMKGRLLPRADTNGDGAIDKQEAEKMSESF